MRTMPDWSVLLFGEAHASTLPPTFSFYTRSPVRRRHSRGRGSSPVLHMHSQSAECERSSWQYSCVALVTPLPKFLYRELTCVFSCANFPPSPHPLSGTPSEHVEFVSLRRRRDESSLHLPCRCCRRADRHPSSPDPSCRLPPNFVRLPATVSEHGKAEEDRSKSTQEQTAGYGSRCDTFFRRSQARSPSSFDFVGERRNPRSPQRHSHDHQHHH